MINTGCLETRVAPFQKDKGTWIGGEVPVRKLEFGGSWLKGGKAGVMPG